MVDVGYGNAMYKPLPLSGEVLRDVSGMYRVEPVGEQYDLQRKQDDQWLTIYRFSTHPKALKDFNEGCHYMQTFPSSPFTQMRCVTIATKQGRITAMDNTLIITEGNTRKKETFDEEEFPKILKTYFGITL